MSDLRKTHAIEVSIKRGHGGMGESPTGTGIRGGNGDEGQMREKYEGRGVRM